MGWTNAGGWRGQGWGRAAAAAAAYTGPGDVQGSATSFWGLRAYSQAKATAQVSAIDLVDQAGANPITIAVKTNGDLDIASISAWVSSFSVTTIRIPKLWDQVGTNHMTQATLANMPSLVLTGGFGTGPAVHMVFVSASAQHLSVTLGAGISQPFTLSAVALSSDAATTGSVIGTSTSSVDLGFADEATPRRLFAFSGSNGFSTATVALGSPATLIGFYNGASSHNNYNGSSNAMNPGANALGTDLTLGRWPTNEEFGGSIVEAGLWGSVSWTTTTSSNLSSNQRAYWGF
jgi:hypothetical protein